MIKFICYPKCTTCQKSKKWLDDNKIDYIHLIEYGKKITEEKISTLNDSLSFLNFLQEDIERINSYSDYESKEFNFDEKY